MNNGRPSAPAMPAILIVAHAPLASALLAVAAHVYPECEAQIAALDVGAQDSVEQVDAAARAALQRLGATEALLLTDVANATPCNGLQRLLGDPALKLRLLSGVNVPMLWRALCYRERPLDEIVRRAIDGATMGVLHLSPSRPQHQNAKNPGDDPNPHHDQ